MYYDLIVLGGGPAGYCGAERAADHGMKVLLCEQKRLGGVCLNEGCIPTKTMLYAGKLFDHACNSAPFGVVTEHASIDHSAVVSRKNRVVETLVSGVETQMRGRNISVCAGHAEILGKAPEGFCVRAGGETHTAARLLIATGSQAVVPPILGVREGMERGDVMTSREILELKQLPESLAIIGGGVIGLEMAAYFSMVGVRVTVIEMLEQIAGACDPDISKLLQKELKKKGITFCLGCTVTAVEPGRVYYEKNGEAACVEAEKVLLSIGRRPQTDGLGLESIGVNVARSAIVTDAHLCTNVTGVYAAGDVNGKVMLAHTAYRESEVAVNHMCGIEDRMAYESIPAVVYTAPEAAWVGMSEPAARAAGHEVRTVKTSMLYAGRFVAENEKGAGICKLVADNSGRLLGIHLLGSYASEIIWGAVPLITNGVTAEELQKNVFPHPTVAEVIREAVFQLKI